MALVIVTVIAGTSRIHAIQRALRRNSTTAPAIAASTVG